MTDTLVERLRAKRIPGEVDTSSLGYSRLAIPDPDCTEAADRIIALEALLGPDFAPLTNAALRKRIIALEAENSVLAAGSCDVEGGKVGDDHGHPYCTLQAKIAHLEADVARLRGECDKAQAVYPTGPMEEAGAGVLRDGEVRRMMRKGLWGSVAFEVYIAMRKAALEARDD